jgi:2-hydroxycyclohexanecarboxyl-CoA dehydrogenase
MGEFVNKLVVITGGVQPNTLAMVEKYAAAGAKVAVLTQSEAQIPGAVCYLCDIGVYADVEKTFAAIKAELGPVDILIHNPIAACGKTLLETSYEEWDRIMAVNTHSLFYCTKQVAQDMKERQTGELIIFSDPSANGVAGNAAYAVTKGAALGFTFSAARETEKYTITTNAVTPNADATPQEVADAVVLLTSEAGRAFHSQAVKVFHSKLEG